MRCSVGQNWNGTTCTGTATQHDWEDAKEIASDKSFAGFSDWRLPTIKELSALVYCSNGKQRKFEVNGWETVKHEGSYGCGSDIRGSYKSPTINSKAFPNTPSDWFWSSSPYAHNSSNAWFVYFDVGTDSYDNRNNTIRVRLVRAGQ